MVESVIDEVAGLKAASTKQTLHLQHYNDFLIYNNYFFVVTTYTLMLDLFHHNYYS